MKVIYLKKTGGISRGEVKDVAEGYARNFLLPRGAAAKATPELIRKLAGEVAAKAKEKTDSGSAAKAAAESIRGRRVEIKAKANEAGRLYAAISADDIRSALKSMGAAVVSSAKISAGHIKEAGEYKVEVDFGSGIKSHIKLIVRV